MGIRAKFEGSSTLKITLDGKSQEVTFVKKTLYAKYSVGKFTVSQRGYHFVELEGVAKSGSSFGDISEILLEIRKIRPINDHSLISNLLADYSGDFVFFNCNFYGFTSLLFFFTSRKCEIKD